MNEVYINGDVSVAVETDDDFIVNSTTVVGVFVFEVGFIWLSEICPKLRSTAVELDDRRVQGNCVI